MNRFAPYAAFITRLAVGGVFLHHGITKFRGGVAGVAAFFGSVGIPLPHPAALLVITVETVGAACVILGVLTRVWAALMTIEMVVAILVVQLPAGHGFELEALLLAGGLTLVALGDGPLAVGMRFKSSRG